MVIDSHCHAGKGDLMTAPWNTDAPIQPYLRRAKAAGIDKTVIFAPIHSDYAKANEQTARIVARYPGRLIGFAFVHAKRDAGRIFPMIERAVKLWRFRGVKVHGHQAMPTREVCEAVQAFGLPMLVDVADRPEVIDMLAPQYPGINFIVAHLGSFADDWRAHQRVIEQLVRYPNVFSDTAAVQRFDYILQAVKRAGPTKILMGSDGPWLHPGLEVQKIRLLGLPPEDEALVLGGNAVRLMRSVRAERKATVAVPRRIEQPRSLHLNGNRGSTNGGSSHRGSGEGQQYQL
jgi:predicted TIM-barrel fold metal-dependent hydrolase